MLSKIVEILKFLLFKPKIADGCLAVGDTTNDFGLSDIKNLSDVLSKSVKQDDKIIQRNQNKNRWSTMFCTAVAPICAIASIYNRELSDIEMKKFFDYAKKEYGYREGVGNDMKIGVDAARNYWNSTLAGKSETVMSFLTTLNSKDIQDCFNKGYACTFCYNGNTLYNEDKKDRLLQGTSFGVRQYGHCIMLYKDFVYDSNKGDFDDSYKIWPGNLQALIDSGCYANEAYVFLPFEVIIAKPKSKLQLYLERIALARKTK